MNFTVNPKKLGLIFVEVLAVILLFIAIGGGLVAWRLLSAPLDAEFARPYVEAALRDADAGYAVKMDRIVLQWPDVNGPILLGVQNGRVVSEKDGHVMASIEEAGIGLSKINLLFGRVVPIGLVLKKPVLRVVRSVDNEFNVGFEPSAHKTQVVEPEEDPLQVVVDILLDPRSQQAAASNLSLMQSLQILDAKVVVEDHVIDMNWVLPRLDAAIERRDNGVYFKGDVFFSRFEERTPALKVEAFLDTKTKVVKTDTTLEYFNPAFIAQRIPALEDLNGLNGRIDARLKMDFTTDKEVLRAEMTALAEKGSFDIPQYFEGTLPYKDLGFVAVYDGSSHILQVKRVQATIHDAVVVEGSGNLVFQAGAFQGPFEVKLAPFAQSQIQPLWPMNVRDEPAYEWVVEKLSDGSFKDVSARLALKGAKGEEGWSYDLDNAKLAFAFEGMSVNYRAPLAPVKNVSGQGTFNLKEEDMRIEITSGDLLDMKVESATLDFVDIIEKGKGIANIDIKLAGNVPSVLKYVSAEPIAVSTPIDAASAKGTADLDVHLKIPTRSDLKFEDVVVEVSGTMQEAFLPGVFKGMDLSGGPFALSVKDNLFTTKGTGTLSGKPIDVTYEEFLRSEGQAFESKIKAKISGVDDAMRESMGMDLSVFMSGPANVDVTYTSFNDDRAEADVAVDFGPSNLYIEPMKYEKAPGENGNATLKAYLVNGDLKEIKDLSGTAPNLRLGATELKFRQDGAETELESGSASQFTIGETVAALQFSFDANDMPSLNLQGAMLDARPFMSDDEGEEQADDDKMAIKLDVAVDRMRTTDEDYVQYAKFKADIDALGRYDLLRLDGAVGQGNVSVRYGLDAGGNRVFGMEATDAGAALKAFGVYENVIGGRLVIDGTSATPGGRDIVGRAEMTEFRVVKAPVLARLLSAMSLPGVSQLLNNDGVVFTKLESGFEWAYNEGGSSLVLKEGRTSGNSLGLTFDGSIDTASRTIDIKGTVIPLSGINNIIGNIPLVGDIITGGTGSLIAATYTMRGSGEDVDTDVNPLSVLTPGILRRVLFE